MEHCLGKTSDEKGDTMSFYASSLLRNFRQERNKLAGTIAAMAGITYEEFADSFNAWSAPLIKSQGIELSYYLGECHRIVKSGNKLPWQHPDNLIIVANDHHSVRLWRQRNDIPAEYFTMQCLVVTPKDRHALDGIDTRGYKYAIASGNVNIFNLDPSISNRLSAIENVTGEYQ